MANRRMFSKAIVSSTKFLKMPSDSQNLYFHLCMNADDDGVVEAYSVMKVTGSSEDNLKVLSAKEFIRVLNEDLVSHILDWNEHNLIRSDRKVDSIYKELLLRIVPEIELKESRPRADVIKTPVNIMDSIWTAEGQHMDSIGKVRLGKDRIGKDSVVPDMEIPRKLAQMLYNGIMKNELAPTYRNNPPRLESWAKDIEKLIRIDGIPEPLISTTIEKVVKHSFWSKNVLSGEKLRKHFNRVYSDVGLGKLPVTKEGMQQAVEETRKKMERLGLL